MFIFFAVPCPESLFPPQLGQSNINFPFAFLPVLSLRSTLAGPNDVSGDTPRPAHCGLILSRHSGLHIFS